MTNNKVACRTPTKGRDGVTNIPAWKFDAVNAAVLEVVADAGADGLAHADLPDAVRARLAPDELERLGSVGWHVTTVKLELEVRGRLLRRSGGTPQRLIIA